MELKDYLHLYIGCKCVIEEFGAPLEPLELTGVSYDDTNKTWWAYFENTEVGYAPYSKIKPILRPLSDMTEEECHEYGVESDGGVWLYGSISSDCTVGGHHHILEITRIAEITRQLCKSGFDCFELIENGLAIDKTKNL